MILNECIFMRLNKVDDNEMNIHETEQEVW